MPDYFIECHGQYTWIVFDGTSKQRPPQHRSAYTWPERAIIALSVTHPQASVKVRCAATPLEGKRCKHCGMLHTNGTHM